MFKLKKHLLLFKIVLFLVLGLFLIANNHQVMAMENNKGKQILNDEPSDQEINNFFKLVKKSQENIKQLKQKYPHLKNASIKEIENFLSFNINQQQTNNNNKKRKLDLNTIPEEN
ncbi:SVM family protein [Paulownia witches'-broom phytoplasma]|uniref:SVM family protein n=1 Tax=Paulownia witches'-broom phytoplasma TaxID=39647 RepID=A0ABX8TS69_9MOLU|nr:SVM family protein [Paulownia witches'-broom phytoplasma]QYC31202.1 SVM family protein [Paulownia witches'-broom phytoplasma]QYC31203.1 SVM family protein [Paulownia witches'-broom phytoplasma]